MWVKSILIAAFCLGFSRSPVVFAADPAATPPKSAPAKEARAGYDASIAKAQEEFEIKTKAARADFDTKLKTARMEYVKKLNNALSDAMVRKDLPEANRIDAAIKTASTLQDADPLHQRTTYLSDLEESEVAGHAYGKKGWGFGEKVIANGVYSPNGILIHPSPDRFGHVKFPLPGAFQTFRAKVDLNGGTQQSVSAVTFRVLGDGKILWQSEPSNKGNSYQPVSVSIVGVKVLELQVECAGDYTGAHCAWIEPAVVK